MKYLIILVILILIGVGGFYIQSKDHDNAVTQGMMKMSDDMHKGMGHDDHAMMVKDDKSFIEGMIPHHEEAVVSSKELLEVAQTPEVKELAQNIITAQEKEISQMKAWHQSWFDEPYKDNGMYKPMMKPLNTKEAQSAEQSYLHDMITHHQAAVAMAKAIQPITKREELKTLSNDIISTQNEEIILMQRLLKK